MEIELKYSVPSDKAEKILQDMSADFGSEIRSIPMEAIYYDTEDKDFISLVEKYNKISYDAIYIPLCMGETYSDYLGLRLSMFFRLWTEARIKSKSP